MTEIDLLGDPVQPAPRGRRAGGYAKPPGSGPTGETCGSCEHYTRVHSGAGIYRKCGLIEAHWTRGPGTDIKKKSPACSLWEQPKNET